MTSAISFQGIATNLPTDELISAVIAQESQPMEAMQAAQTTNTTKQTALNTLSTDLTTLGTAMTSLATTGFSGNTVTSSDSNNTYVSASASNAASGEYQVTVNDLATTARLVVPTALQPDAAVGIGTYVITDMAGNQVDVNITSANNTLAGLATAINTATEQGTNNPSDVNATVIQTGSDGSSQLVLSAVNTGLGANGAASFSITPPASGSTLFTGATSSTSAVDASVTINGVTITSASNAVTSAVQGVTFNLNQADGSQTTTFNVSQDVSAATTAVQTVVTDYNKLLSDYQSNTTFTQNADGSITAGVFNDDPTIQNIMAQVEASLMGTPAGLPSTAAYTNPADIGLSTTESGSLTLNTSQFQSALTDNPTAVENVFGNSGVSTDPLLTFVASGPNTTNSPITYSITTVNGVLTGTFQNQMPDGSIQTNTLTSTDGNFYGASGTALAGLAVQASDGASGTLTVSTGVATSLQSLINTLTSSNPGDIGGLVSDLGTDNANLSLQIQQQQTYLANSKSALQATYANLESTVSSLQSAGQSLSTL